MDCQLGALPSPTPRVCGSKGVHVQAAYCIRTSITRTSRHGMTQPLTLMTVITERSKSLSKVSNILLKPNDNAYPYKGTAIYAYFIVPDNVAAFTPNVTLLTNMSVILDDELVGNVLHMPQGQSDFIYNFLGYSNSSLSNDTHMMTISANNQVSSSLILFDYLIYT